MADQSNIIDLTEWSRKRATAQHQIVSRPGWGKQLAGITHDTGDGKAYVYLRDYLWLRI